LRNKVPAVHTNEICQLLEWDTEFFGFRIARVIPTRLDKTVLGQILFWCQTQAIQCLYFLSDADNAQSIELAEKNEFSLVDIRVTLKCQLNNLRDTSAQKSPELLIRPYQADDLPNLRTIAQNNYGSTRFYYDARFSKAKASDLYVTWIAKSCQGYANAVLVAERNNTPTGYVTCHISSPELGRIGLVGIDMVEQGAGTGQNLLNGALEWFVTKDIREVEVVTQGRNGRALRLYERCGFLTQTVQLWYHKWFLSQAAEQ
jgi:dTDP-4-amino-4,6-dideoxy-D-galactose acyltransferase